MKMQKRSDKKRLTLAEDTAPIGLTLPDGKDAEKRTVYTSTFMFVYTEKKKVTFCNVYFGIFFQGVIKGLQRDYLK